ncbi:hypothetical protein DFQ28_005860 [Apophysomyces sp. BC1034]|nr:hypothetical protein DFQ28_005860 [Apophysomyces sp. BC1034]
MARAAATRDWALLDQLFKRDFATSSGIFIVMALGVLIVDRLLADSRYAHRVLPFWQMAGLIVFVLSNQLIGGLAAHLRSYRREPFMAPLVVSTVVTLPLIFWAAAHYSSAGLVAVLASVNLLLNLPIAIFALPLLTIAIPTFTRANYLELNLQRLVEEARALPPSVLEVIVSDNCSTDTTPDVVTKAVSQGLSIRYIRNKIDIGSDANIAQCFNEARGHYVQIMGDDDMYVRGMLSYLIGHLQQAEYGIVCLRPFGYETDPEQEYPGEDGPVERYDRVGDFLAAVGSYITFISACIINKRAQEDIDARQFCGSNLVQVHLVVNAALQVRHNAYMKRYMLACKRANSGGYDFSEVFVERLGRILDSYRPVGLTAKDIDQFETRMLKSYHPFNLVRQRLARQGDLRETHRRFAARFGLRPLFVLWVAPIIHWPRPLALAWGMMATIIGRISNGDLRRGAHFALNKLRRHRQAD